MDFKDGELVRISETTGRSSIANGVYTYNPEPTLNEWNAVVTSNHGLALNNDTLEVVPIGRKLTIKERNATLLQLTDSNLNENLVAECGLVRAVPVSSIKKLNLYLTEADTQIINRCVEQYLTGAEMPYNS